MISCRQIKTPRTFFRSRQAGLRIVAILAATIMIVQAVAASSAGAEEHCANEALRAQLNSSALPDCRAYEMLTPAYKAGGSENLSRYSSDGNKGLLIGEGLFAGDPGEGERVTESSAYLDTRTSTGWEITPLNAPLSEFVGQYLIAPEIEDGETLWVQHTPEQSAVTRGLYIRTEQGEYKYVGRLNPVPGGEEESSVMQTTENDYDRPLASTSNFDHIVVFASEGGDYWKEIDGTKGEAGSVYEYSGTNDPRPTLVEVEGEKGSSTLVGECGAFLGSGSNGSEYNALSADGESIVFSVDPEGYKGCPAKTRAPAYQEVYMRVHGSDASTAKAETVHVSASECSSECGSESGKEFEGASENNEKLFFTSTQKLTDNATNGTESGDATEKKGCAQAREHGGCNLYEFDFERANGRHMLHLIAGGDEVLGVAAVAGNGERVYFVAAKALPSADRNEWGKEAQEGEDNLYVYDTVTKTTSYIATLVENDEEDWQRSQTGRNVEAAGADGQYLLFPSEAQLIPGEISSAHQIYEYDAETRELVRVSKGEAGFDENGLNSSSEIHAWETTTEYARKFRSRANIGNIAENGRTVVFESTGELSSRAATAAAGDCSSVYEFRAPAGGPISQGEVHLISDGEDVQPHKSFECGAVYELMDGEGENILFATDDPLLPSDTNGFQRDVYDARVEGGFAPAPSTGETALCGGGAGCGGVQSGLLLVPPASMTDSAEGNLSPAPSTPVVSKPKKAKQKKKSRKKERRHGARVKSKGRVKKSKGRAKKSGRSGR